MTVAQLIAKLDSAWQAFKADATELEMSEAMNALGDWLDRIGDEGEEEDELEGWYADDDDDGWNEDDSDLEYDDE